MTINNFLTTDNTFMIVVQLTSTGRKNYLNRHHLARISLSYIFHSAITKRYLYFYHNCSAQKNDENLCNHCGDLLI